MSYTPDRPWVKVYVGGTHGVGGQDLTDYVAVGLSVSGGSQLPFEDGDATVAAFQVVKQTGDTIQRPDIGDEVFIAAAPPYVWDAPDDAVYWRPIFFGLVTDLSEQQLEPDGWTVWTVNAVDTVGVLAGVTVGDEPWGTQSLTNRLSSLQSAINDTLGSPWWLDLDHFGSSHLVLGRDVDRQDALELLRSYARTADLGNACPQYGYSYVAAPADYSQPRNWTVKQYVRDRLSTTVDIVANSDNYANVPIQAVEYGPRTLYSRQTVTTEWRINHGPAGESDTVFDVWWLSYQYKESEADTTKPTDGQAIYYSKGTGSSGDDPPVVWVAKVDRLGVDQSAYLLNWIPTTPLYMYAAGRVTGCGWYVDGVSDQGDYVQYSFSSTFGTSTYGPSTFETAELAISARYPQLSVTATDTTASAAVRRARTVTTELEDPAVARRLAYRALDATKNLQVVHDRLRIYQTTRQDYEITTDSAYSGDPYYYSVWQFWIMLPNLIAGGAGWAANLVLFDADAPTTTRDYRISLGGVFTTGTDGHLLELATVDASAYLDRLRPDTYHTHTADNVTLT